MRTPSMSTSPIAIVSPDTHLINEAGQYEWSVPRVQKAWDMARAHLRAVLPNAERLVLMVGVPGAGKSTWLAAHGEPGAVYFDATLCGDRARAEFVTLARSMGKPVEVVWLDTPLAVCLARNAARTPDRRVPEAEVRKMADKLSRFPPHVREGFVRVTRVRHPDRPYKYRGLPCNIAPNHQLWCVSGRHHDNTGVSAGVLEWCYNRRDAEHRLSLMREDARFTHLRAHPWQE